MIPKGERINVPGNIQLSISPSKLIIVEPRRKLNTDMAFGMNSVFS